MLALALGPRRLVVAGVSRLRVQCRPPTVSHTVFHGAVVVGFACVGVGVSRHQCGFGVCQVVACLVKACHCVTLVVVVVVVVSVLDRPRILGCFASVPPYQSALPSAAS